ncbi:MAG TPA: hypothetical protein VEQ58_20590, partial [Polyangiaceae bacterium]|nr:hypothetical protein [Polyangiaceae bacterium]
MTSVLGDDGLKARSAMQAGLLRSFFWLSTITAAGLTLRELLAGSPVVAAVLAMVLGGAGWVLARGEHVPLRALGLVFFCSLVLLVTKAGLDLGGAAGSALSFSFIPGFLAVLVLGPRWGWPVCALMLTSLAWLGATTPLPLRYDRLRFLDEVAMTVFTAALAHSLLREFGSCEAVMMTRRRELSALRAQRQAMTLAIYEQLEPLATQLVEAVPQRGAAEERASFQQIMRQLVQSLGRAKALAHREEGDAGALEDPEQLTRRQTMRVWLKLGAGLMAFFALRNAWVGAPFVPSIFSFVFCLAFDFWLGR